jgi:hypothetical protein
MDGMFNWPRGDNEIVSPYVYVFFVITIPLTLIVYAGWAIWFRRMESQHRATAPDIDFGAFESDLMKRMRTATNSWSVEKQTTLGTTRT